MGRLKNVSFVIWGLPKCKTDPYNPPIAEERGAKRRRAPRQASEIKSNLGFRFRVSASDEKRK
jgi:hypothetical protein